MSNKVHVIPHMHWDREWYFTTEESRILLVNNMEEIMDMLETNSEYPHYILDGQTAILEDYFDVVPEGRERVKKLVQSGKLIIGPWYTQTDEMVVGGESIVRNLLYGMKDCEEFGEPMKIGYLPDSFGQSEKLPQILNGFDIKRAIFWRGASERHGTNKNNFYWKSKSEGEVLAHLLPLGYAIGKYLPEEKTALEKRMSKYMPVLEKGATGNDICLPNGHDQMPIQKNIFDVMKTLKEIYPQKEFFLSKYENLFAEIEKSEKLDTITGELLDGKYMRVHRSIFSSRADLKSANTRIENKITNILEPLMTIAYSLGAEYHHGLVEAIWKELLKNHAHDSIGCCCSDKVHKAIANRFFLAEDKTDELIAFYKRKIVDSISSDIALDKLTAFNLLPYERKEVVTGEIITKMKNFRLETQNGEAIAFEVVASEVVDAGLIDRQIVHYGDYDPFVKYTLAFEDTIPAMGYKTYLIKESAGEIACKNQVDSECVENEFYRITPRENGTLEIWDKRAGKLYKNVLLLEDGGDDGDGYDYSEMKDDYIITSENVISSNKTLRGSYISNCEMDFTFPVPKNLNSRSQKIIDSEIYVKFGVQLESGSEIIKITAEIDNKACDHRVRVLIPTDISSKFSLSDNQFGEIERGVRDSAMDVWESEGWDERPDSIYPMLSYVALENHAGLAVLTNSVREFEIVGENYSAIAITLFRSVGFLGKEEMVRRPGRPSGIKMPTPDSQLLGKMTFEFAITKGCENISRIAKEYLTPMVCYNKMPYNAMKLNTPNFTSPYEYSLLGVKSDHFVLSAFKKAEKEDGYILRGYQTAKENEEIKISANVLAQVNLNEDIISSEEPINFNIPKNVVKNYYVKK